MTQKSALLPLQSAIYGVLNGHVTGSVYDQVPKDAAFPHSVIGDDTSNDWSTKDIPGEEDTVTIHVWSQKQGATEVKTIMDEITQKLTESGLSVTGFGTCYAVREFFNVSREPDGITRHGVMRFRFQILQEA